MLVGLINTVDLEEINILIFPFSSIVFLAIGIIIKKMISKVYIKNVKFQIIIVPRIILSQKYLKGF